MRVISVESTELFVGTPEQPLQVVAAGIEHLAGRSVRVTVEGEPSGRRWSPSARTAPYAPRYP